MRRAVQICALAGAAWAAWAWWIASAADRGLENVESWRLQLEHDMDDLEERTRQAFEAHAARLDALEARPSIEDALVQFSQRFLADRVRQARGEGRPGPQG